MLVSKISSKGQITIPKQVRDAIGVSYGDVIRYEVRGSVASIRRIEPLDAAFHAAVSQTLTEWTSPEDEEAFRDL